MENKQFYIKVNGQKVPVSEEVYRAYVRPITSSQRTARRNSKCLVKGKRSGLVRCKNDCSKCPYYSAGNKLLGGVLSLDVLKDDGKEEAATSDIEHDLIEFEENNQRIAALHRAIEKLNERQQYIVREIFFKGKTQEEVRQKIGISKSSMSEAYHCILRLLKNFLQEN